MKPIQPLTSGSPRPRHILSSVHAMNPSPKRLTMYLFMCFMIWLGTMFGDAEIIKCAWSGIMAMAIMPTPSSLSFFFYRYSEHLCDFVAQDLPPAFWYPDDVVAYFPFCILPFGIDLTEYLLIFSRF